MEDKNEYAHDVEEQEESLETQDYEDESQEVDYKALYEAELARKKLKRQRFAEKAKSQPEQKITNNSSDASWKLRMELKVEGYNDEEASFIMKNGGKKALENPYILSAIENMREKKIAEAAMIDVSTKSESEKRYSPEELSKLPSDEQLKVLRTIK